MKNKVITETYTPNCKSHKCSVCKHKLRRGYSRGEKIFFLALIGIYISMIWWSVYSEERISSTPDCYVKELQSKNSQQEFWVTKYQKCPKDLIEKYKNYK